MYGEQRPAAAATAPERGYLQEQAGRPQRSPGNDRDDVGALRAQRPGLDEGVVAVADQRSRLDYAWWPAPATARPDRIVIQVVDDGLGLLEGARTSGGRRIRSLRRAAKDAGGTLRVSRNQQGFGTCVSASLPM